GKINGTPSVEIWGDGSPQREFMHTDDLASACTYLMREYNGRQFVNIGVGEDISIKDLALMIKDVVGFEGELSFDTSKPTGTPRKLMDSSRLFATGFQPQIELRAGIEMVYEDFKAHQSQYESGQRVLA
ncbi:MAG: NAD-dependent epimerase/dehydratase family protein, partial [Bacteroidota bacterium]